MRAMGGAAAISFLVLCVPAPATAQVNLVLPRDARDFRELTKTPPGQPCEQCGIVTDIRSGTKEMRTVRVADEQSTQLVATPLIVGNRDGLGHAPGPDMVTTYTVTVRYDNGMYAAFEQNDEPDLQKGERIEVRDGRVERR